MASGLADPLTQNPLLANDISVKVRHRLSFFGLGSSISVFKASWLLFLFPLHPLLTVPSLCRKCNATQRKRQGCDTLARGFITGRLDFSGVHLSTRVLAKFTEAVQRGRWALVDPSSPRQPN